MLHRLMNHARAQDVNSYVWAGVSNESVCMGNIDEGRGAYRR